jgi:hypothetical protein
MPSILVPYKVGTFVSSALEATSILLLLASIASASVVEKQQAIRQTNNYYQGGRHVILDKYISQKRIECEGKPTVLAACSDRQVDDENCIMECVSTSAAVLHWRNPLTISCTYEAVEFTTAILWHYRAKNSADQFQSAPRLEV